MSALFRQKVVIADDHRLVAECLAEQLTARYDVVAVVHGLAEVIPAIVRTAPDAIILDLSFGRDSALPLLPVIRRSHPSVFVVVVTMHEEPALAEASVAAGAHHYVVKTQGTAEVLEVLSTMDSMHAVPQAEATRSSIPTPFGGSVRRGRRQVGAINLSARQYEILRLLSVGATRGAVALELGISAKGVDYNVNEVKRLIGVRRLISVISWFRDAVAAMGNGEEKPPGAEHDALKTVPSLE